MAKEKKLVATPRLYGLNKKPKIHALYAWNDPTAETRIASRWSQRSCLYRTSATQSIAQSRYQI